MSQCTRLCKEEKDPTPADTALHKEEKDSPADTTLHKEEADPPPHEPSKVVYKTDEPYRKHKYVNPIQRTFGILADDVRQFFGHSSKNRTWQNEEHGEGMPRYKAIHKQTWPSDCDVLVVGGGVMGSSIAYHLQERALDGLRIVVVEEDPSVSIICGCPKNRSCR